MPITTRYVPDSGVFETLMHGVVSDDDYLENYGPFFRAGTVPQDSLELVIVESSATINVSSKGFVSIVKILKDYYQGDKVSRVAVVSHGPKMDHYLSLYESVVELMEKDRHEVRAFDAVSNAMEWLLGHRSDEHH